MEAENLKRSRCTVESDLELLRRYQNGDQQALEDLTNGHFGLIYFWVGKMLAGFPWASREDLRQEACVGFIEAAKKFDASLSNDFHSDARDFVRAAIYRSPEVRRVRRSLYRNYRKVLTAYDKLIRELERRPTLEEIAEETKLSERQVQNALNVNAAFPLPLDEADARDEIEEPHHSQLIRDVLKKLNSYHAQVVIRYYFYGQTDREIAEDLGTSEEAIKQARQRALKKLREITGGDVRDET